ncbi:2'-5' RNA ligase family protein [Actinoalloteichus hymeniacidonis]|uniref:RNA 2',3'-cyclic phosphodiesterase n=1 Tax=Actinoalloteichus hymeniacidonis TaxID=340345 RepID=A0AAC9HNV2_9PSEU|nr:2'-5' RNA ligase family protein [Actinoalloteichus hymeniacidonis]AOS62664.1 2'-5' RNA ligase [Actinoalloteichus hymeniacidonis]MBB5909305.1 2'-5' RNA ligase [Actinoalloteichus hymeniacidonis]
MRAFTALWPSEHVVDDLAAALQAVRDRSGAPQPGLRFGSLSKWHLTLCFHGELADPAAEAHRLRASVRDLPAPRLRLAGAGTFPGVLWVGVRPEGEADSEALTSLVTAAGGEPDDYRPHLTLARWDRRRPKPADLVAALADYAGPVWQPATVALLASGAGDTAEFTSLAEFPLER